MDDMTNNNAFSGKTLRRSRDHRMISGVCGGLGEYFNVDPTLIRLGVVALSIFTSGAGILAYAIAWIVMPEADGSSVLQQAQDKFQQNRGAEEDIAARIYDEPKQDDKGNGKPAA